MNKNIVLIGMMGSGKSTLAKLLNEHLNAPVLSTDAMIEAKAGSAIRDIVAKHGWDAFRALEHAAVTEAAAHKGAIIDCGGGVVLRRENLDLLKRNGIIFYLSTTPDILFERIKNDPHRPLVHVPDPQAQLRQILNERLPLYEQADFTIDASDPSMKPALAQILSKV